MTADFDPIVMKMRRQFHVAERSPFLDANEKRLLKLEAVRDTLIEWADDGLRTGHQLDCIVDAAREARCG